MKLIRTFQATQLLIIDRRRDVVVVLRYQKQVMDGGTPPACTFLVLRKANLEAVTMTSRAALHNQARHIMIMHPGPKSQPYTISKFVIIARPPRRLLVI